MTVFVDTWAWLALALRRDQHHQNAKRRHADLISAGRKYVTTDYVLAELITQLYRVAPANQASVFVQTLLSTIDSGAYKLERISPERFSNAWQLRGQYADKPTISFTDFTSFVVMRELGIREAFSGDIHFKQVNLGFELVP